MKKSIILNSFIVLGLSVASCTKEVKHLTPENQIPNNFSNQQALAMCEKYLAEQGVEHTTKKRPTAEYIRGIWISTEEIENGWKTVCRNQSGVCTMIIYPTAAIDPHVNQPDETNQAIQVTFNSVGPNGHYHGVSPVIESKKDENGTTTTHIFLNEDLN
ncbi:hypothetical protein [Luteibaculum oceani]|uniref:Lipoprotein n=1 Tax=Luteibaculum oceani TaxID=1294296 RepID=A0A5C6UYB2_9FLAO|nr:hypothetical protein [Luteibaculum oceani]TXC75625.1 hypothetical protein FRX97_11645 [Luteibaculum oceani]